MQALSVIQGLQRIIDGITTTGTLGRPRKSEYVQTLLVWHCVRAKAQVLCCSFSEKFSKAQRRKSTLKPPLYKLRDLQKNIEGWEVSSDFSLVWQRLGTGHSHSRKLRPSLPYLLFGKPLNCKNYPRTRGVADSFVNALINALVRLPLTRR